MLRQNEDSLKMACDRRNRLGLQTTLKRTPFLLQALNFMQDGWPASPHHIAAVANGRAVGSAENFLLSSCIYGCFNTSFQNPAG